MSTYQLPEELEKLVPEHIDIQELLSHIVSIIQLIFRK